MSGIPQAVLSEALGEAIAGRRVLAAVFTTFTFDPGFFEFEVLPTLFDRSFSHIDKIRRIQLEEALQRVDVAVYYDRTGLVPNAQPAALDFRRIDVRRRTGCFHPKLALVLVETRAERADDEELEPERALIVAALSANLTRSGWWENVETGHVEEIRPPGNVRDTCPYRRDLLGLLRNVQRGAGKGDDHTALELVRRFLRTEAPRRELTNVSAGGQHYTRLFTGQEHLADWLRSLRLGRYGYHLEILSPYLDAHGASALERLVEALGPDEVRVLLPHARDGEPAVTQEQYDAVAELATWCRLPEELTRSGPRASNEKSPPRFVHAKMIRLWKRGVGELVVVGSANLTEAGCGTSRSGNLEASFFVDVSRAGHGGAWLLEPLETEPTSFRESPCEEADEGERVGATLSLRFDWLTKTLQTRLEEPYDGAVEVASLAGETLCRVDGKKAGEWVGAGAAASKAVHELLPSTSVLSACTRPSDGGDGVAWRVLVREECMSHKPSLLFDLSPEEILMYWSLLTAEQREAFCEEKLGPDARLEGIHAGRGSRYRTDDTLFGRFAGLYHAFEQAGRAIRRALDEGDPRAAEALLFGAKYDSVPVLLRRVRERIEEPPDGEEADPVHAYVTFLCARQLAERVRKGHPDFWKEHRDARGPLEDELRHLDKIRAQVPGTGQDEEFLAWYEACFLADAAELESRAG